MKKLLLVIFCLCLGACAAPRPDTAQSRACQAEAERTASKVVPWADPWWSVYENAAYKRCMSK